MLCNLQDLAGSLTLEKADDDNVYRLEGDLFLDTKTIVPNLRTWVHAAERSKSDGHAVQPLYINGLIKVPTSSGGGAGSGKPFELAFQGPANLG